MIKELEVIEEAKILLNEIGESDILYLTAEFAPFSNQQKPDLIFKGKDTKTVYFIEYKRTPKYGYTKDYLNGVLDQKEFVGEDIEHNFNYIFATDGFIGENQAILEQKGIIVLNGVKSGKTLFNKILNIYKNEK